MIVSVQEVAIPIMFDSKQLLLQGLIETCQLRMKKSVWDLVYDPSHSHPLNRVDHCSIAAFIYFEHHLP